MKEFDFNMLLYLFENLYDNEAIADAKQQLKIVDEQTHQIKANLDLQKLSTKPEAIVKQSRGFHSDATRIYTHYEIDYIGMENISFLLQLEKFNIITQEIKEDVIDQIFYDYNCAIDIEQFKHLVLTNLSKHNYSFGLQTYLHDIRDNQFH